MKPTRRQMIQNATAALAMSPVAIGGIRRDEPELPKQLQEKLEKTKPIDVDNSEPQEAKKQYALHFVTADSEVHKTPESFEAAIKHCREHFKSFEDIGLLGFQEDVLEKLLNYHYPYPWFVPLMKKTVPLQYTPFFFETSSTITVSLEFSTEQLEYQADKMQNADKLLRTLVRMLKNESNPVFVLPAHIEAVMSPHVVENGLFVDQGDGVSITLRPKKKPNRYSVSTCSWHISNPHVEEHSFS